MRYLALACDYDGTLASNGQVSQETKDALEQLRASGRKIILVTGRELDDLSRVFEPFELFERVVAENGAVLYNPATREQKTLADPPPREFLESMRSRGVTSLSQGKVIVATHEPNERIALELIRDLGLELQVIFNKGSVMILPATVNKATGLAAALRELGLSIHNVVGIGDGENDHSFLNECELSVAVADAVSAIKKNADFVTTRNNGGGVTELVHAWIEDDLASVTKK